MVQTCSKCSRANPAEAVYCYYDGLVLGGHSRNGGPVAVGAQAFAHPFVFPGGRQCHSFDELALASQEEWTSARDLLKQGYLENFFGGLGRVDLAMAAKDAAKFPDADRGLDQLLEKLPTQVLGEPRLSLETQEVNLGVLSIGAERDFTLSMENQGMRLVYGTITSVDGPWLALGDTAANEKHIQFQHDLSLPIRVRSDKLRANTKPLEAHLEVETNGGSFIVVVRAQVPVQPFPSGALAGAKSPRQAAEKAKVNAKEAAALFESGAVADWYKSNGWTYPVQGPAASGLGAVQQFFEALGLTPPPKVEISAERIDLTGNAGEQLRHSIEVKSKEKRPVYAHATSNEPWLEVSRAKLNGRTATIHLSVPSVPNRDGETLTAKLTVQSNGNQRFVVPVTLQIGSSLAFGENNLVFDDPEPAPAPVAASVTKTPSAPAVALAPAASVKTSSEPRRSRSVKNKSAWIHLAPAGLLLLALLTAVIVDKLMPKSGGGGDDVDNPDSGASWTYNVKDSDPLLTVRLSDKMHFGLEMSKVKDPNNEDKYKRLTYESHGESNNTIVKIDGFEFVFGDTGNGNNRWVRGQKKKEIKGRLGWTSAMEFKREHVQVTQHVEIVPGQSGYLDTLLVYYTIVNKDDGKRKVGIRVLLDTFIGTNDGVPFTIPGKKGFVNTKAELSAKQIPDYIEVIEKPNDPKDPGTVVRMGLRHMRLPGISLEDMDKLLICRFPGANARWDWKPVESMMPASAPPPKGKKGKKNPEPSHEKPDSCVAMYWPYEVMNPKETRYVGFTYGLGSLDIDSAAGGTALALSVPASVQPDTDFVVTAYVWRAKKGDKVKLHVPAGLKLAKGENEEKKVEEGGTRSQVFWHLHSGDSGTFTLDAEAGKSKAKPKQVVVKTSSIFG